MQRIARIAGLVAIVAGVLGLAWCLTVWLWQDPFTGLYTRWEQHHLSRQYDRTVRNWQPPARRVPPTANVASERRGVARDATAYRRETHRGQAIGRIVIGRIGLEMVIVDGTDHDSLTRGPGRDLRSFMPGQNRLVYIAGHRTTYLAPFSHIDDIRKGDYIRIEMPYASFTYRAVGHEIVPATDLAMLRSPRHELLRLQACHPRFFATHRYIVDARLVSVRPQTGRPYTISATAPVP
jgi:sortase A